MKTIGQARQLVTVVAPVYATSVAPVELWHLHSGCWALQAGPWPSLIGLNGFSDHHREGDGTTPTGLYAIGPIVYGNAPNPGAHAPYHRLVCGDWWDEDPTSREYNTFRHVRCGQQPPFGGDSEALWTETVVYPSFAVIEYNMHPTVPYAGSAIFIHASTGAPTVGCVSLPLRDLDHLLKDLNWSLHPAVVMGPSSEVRTF